MSVFGITGVTVSVEIGNKKYGEGQSAFMSITSRLPEGAEPLQLTNDKVMEDGMEKYFTAWETLLQGLATSGSISGFEFKESLATALVRQQKVKAVYSLIKNRSIEELTAYVGKLQADTQTTENRGK